MIKIEDRTTTDLKGKGKAIVIDVPSKERFKTALVGRGMAVIGVTSRATTAVKNGVGKANETKHKTMSSIIVIM